MISVSRDSRRQSRFLPDLCAELTSFRYPSKRWTSSSATVSQSAHGLLGSVITDASAEPLEVDDDGADDSASETSSLMGRDRSRSPFYAEGGSLPTSRKASPMPGSSRRGVPPSSQEEDGGVLGWLGGLMGRKRRSSVRGDYRSVGGPSTSGGE